MVHGGFNRDPKSIKCLRYYDRRRTSIAQMTISCELINVTKLICILFYFHHTDRNHSNKRVTLFYSLEKRMMIYVFDEYISKPPLPKRPHFLLKRPQFFLTKRPHYFVRIKITLPNPPPPFYCQNGTFNNFFLLQRWYHVWCLVIQDLSSKFIYCIYIVHVYLTSDDNDLVYIRSDNCVYKYIKLTYILGNICFVLL